jgi:hypothetical protein
MIYYTLTKKKSKLKWDLNLDVVVPHNNPGH